MSLKDAGWLYAECIHLEMIRSEERLRFLKAVRAAESKDLAVGGTGANNAEGLDRLIESVDISSKRHQALGYHRWAVSSFLAKGIYDPQWHKSLRNRSPHTSTPTTVLALLDGGRHLDEARQSALVPPALLERFRKVADLDQKDRVLPAAKLPTQRQIEAEPLKETLLLKAAMQYFDATQSIQ